MTDLAPHPARSAEFLSRLHDGDLSAAERAQFESHRAHCAGCRNAAADFEAALALYRSSRPQPPAADLSARILRKLQSAHPRRSPFGVTFGIDLRWAGAFLAALIAVIIGSSVVLHREAAERKLLESAPIPIRIEAGRTAGLEKDRRAAPSGAPRPNAQTRDGRPAAAAPPPKQVAGKAQAELTQALRNRAPAAPEAGTLEKETSSRADSERKRVAETSTKPQPPPVSFSSGEESAAGQIRKSELSGGEGAMNSNLAYDKISSRVRVEITAIDGAGTPPALLNGEQVDLPVELRGKEFVLVVEASGRVRSVEASGPGARRKMEMRQEPGRSDTGVADAKAPQSLTDLRFAVSDRPRVLRVRLE